MFNQMTVIKKIIYFYMFVNYILKEQLLLETIYEV